MDNPAQIQYNNKKKKRLIFIFGGIGVFLLLGFISSSQNHAEQNELFLANKETILSDFRTALDEENMSRAAEIKSEFNLIDDYEFKAMISEYKSILKSEHEREKLATKAKRDQEYEDSKVGLLNVRSISKGESFRGKVLDVRVTDIKVTDHVGGAILGEDSQSGVLYFVVDYRYENISKSPTRESPTLSVISPDGATYSADISASALYAGSSDKYNEEVFSELQPRVYSNGVEVFKVPQDFGKTNGWKLKITIEDAMFSKGITRYLPISVR